MRIYPAIDLFEGKVVRLARGDFNQMTVYDPDPAKAAANWEGQGAEWLHIVDLEGAKSGTLKNRPSLLKIREKVQSKIEFGGGLRDIETIRQILEAGIDRVVLGTKALEARFFNQVMECFGSKIAVSLDVKSGKVRTQGWLERGDESLDRAVQRLNETPLEILIYTDIQRDGMLEGPNLSEFSRILKRAKAKVILSGGIGRLEDVKRCSEIRERNFEGVIIGKALYDKKFSLNEALQCSRSRSR